jgi:hypothetical protein
MARGQGGQQEGGEAEDDDDGSVRPRSGGPAGGDLRRGRAGP